MSNAQELSFLITTKAELSGAQQLAASLEQQIGKAKALRQDYSQLKTQLDQVNQSMAGTSPELQKLAGTEKEASESAEFLHKNHRQLHRLFETLPGVANTAGGVMLQAIRGPIGPAIALGIVIEKSVDAFKEWQKSLDEAGESAAQSPFAEAIKKVGEDMEEARSKAEAYRLAIEEIAQHETSIAQALSSQLNYMHALASAREAAAKAEEAHAKARNDRREKTGEITPEQAAINETALEIQAAKNEAARKKKEKDDEVSTKQDALNRAIFSQAPLNAAEAAAAVAVTTAKTHRDRLADFGPEAKHDLFNFGAGVFGGDTVEKGVPTKEALVKARDQVAELEKKVEEAKQDIELSENPITAGMENMRGVTPESAKENYARAQDLLAKAQAQQGNLQRGVRQYDNANSPAANQELQDKENAAEAARKNGKANAEEVDRLRRELDDARKINSATQPAIDKELTERIATILENAVGKLSAMPRGGEVEAGIQISDILEKGQGVGAAQAQYLLQLANNLGLHTQNLKEAADHIEKLKDDTGAFMDAVVRLTSQGFTAQQQQLDALAQMISRVKNGSDLH